MIPHPFAASPVDLPAPASYVRYLDADRRSAAVFDAETWIAPAMAEELYPDDLLREILETSATIALVGASADPMRPSNGVLRFLLDAGYRVHPVNPGLAGTKIHGAAVSARLADIPEPIDIVDIFRHSEAAGQIVDEALELDPLPRTIWMQLGVRNQAAADRARARGLAVIQDRCPKIEVSRLSLARRSR